MHTPAYGQMDMLLDKILIVKDGKILKIAAGSEEKTVLGLYGIPEHKVQRLAVSIPAYQVAVPQLMQSSEAQFTFHVCRMVNSSSPGSLTHTYTHPR